MAVFGYTDVARKAFLGLRANLRLGWPGLVTDFWLVPADLHETTVAAYLLQSTKRCAHWVI